MGDKGNKFVKGAAILGIAGVGVKILGALFRIPLTNWIGEEGMAYYGAAYPVYSLLLIVSTAGIPVAISKMVAERVAEKNYGGADRVFKASIVLMFILGVISFGICFFGADAFSRAVNIPNAALALKTIAPALFFVPIMSSFRGYFQGLQNMNPTAISQIIEQLCRVIVGLALAYILLKSSLAEAAAGATFGASAGSIGGFALIVAIYFINRKTIHKKIEKNPSRIEPTGSIIWQILVIAVPITIGAAIFPIMTNIDTAMIVNRLMDAGYSQGEAEGLFGLMSGFCSSLIGFPQVFTQAVAVSLVPAISAAHQLGDKQGVQDNIKLGLRFTLLLAFPCAAGIFALAEPILKLLFFQQIDSAISAAPTLMYMAVGIIFLAMVQTLTGALQGIGKQMLPVKNLAYGAVVKIVLTYILAGTVFFNVNGAAIGTIGAYVVATVFNIRDLKKWTGTKFDIMITYVKPFAASVAMALVVFFAYKGFALISSNAVATLLSVFVGVLVYGALIIVFKAITKEDMKSFPKGEKIVGLLDKLHIK